MLLGARLALFGGAQNPPPSVTLLEYAQSQNTDDEIMTDFVPQDNDEVYTDFQYTQTKIGAFAMYAVMEMADGANAICGYSGVRYKVGAITSNAVFVSLKDLGFTKKYTTAFITSRLKLNASVSNVSVNGESYDWTSTLTTNTRGRVWIFRASYDNGSSRVVSGGGSVGLKFYEAKYTRNGTIVAHFRPCLDADGVVAITDLISGNVYYNRGANPLIGGNPISA